MNSKGRPLARRLLLGLTFCPVRSKQRHLLPARSDGYPARH